MIARIISAAVTRENRHDFALNRIRAHGRTSVFDRDVQFAAHAELPRQVDPGLDRDHHAGGQHAQGLGKHALLQRRMPGHAVAIVDELGVRMAADDAGGRTRGIEQHGVELLLENIPNELGTPERLVQFLQYSRLDLKICFDTGHAHMTCGVREAYGTLKQHIASTHIHDNHREKDDHLMPFEGGINWQRTVHDFRAADDRFPILFELRDYGPDVTTLARVADVIQRMDGIE